MDPCSIGPLTCGPMNCQEATTANDDKHTTLFTVASQKGLGGFRGPISRSNTNLSNASMTPLENLKQRVSDFQSRGWLSQQEFRQYMALLETAPRSKETNGTVTADYVQSELTDKLDMLEDQMTGGKMMLARNTRKSVLTPRRSAQRNDTTVEKENSDSQVEPPSVRSEPLGDATNKSDNAKSLLIADAKDLAQQLSEDQIQQMFVETCFFARLGFVQPPCCLKCSYRESLKEATPKTSCASWVVWRREAKHILHPHYMKKNAILVKCHVARKLLAGKLVDAHKWDEVNKVLLFPRGPSRLSKGW